MQNAVLKFIRTGVTATILAITLIPYSYAARSADCSAQEPTPAAVTRDVAYGADKLQTIDIYAPKNAQHAPVIFMVHGGAWRFGDKSNTRVVENKIARWVARGFIFISVNYRMLPQLNGLQQADDVARALAFAQTHAGDWGGAANRFILMGHSAGAHLVALLSAAPEMAYGLGTKPWLGAIALDSAALDLVATMQHKHPGFYDQAFGSDSAGWVRASPLQQLHNTAPPLLAVCSTQRRDHPCTQASAFVEKATMLGIHAEVLPQNLSHAQINEQLGLAGAYTDAVETFMATLDPSIAQQLRCPQI